LGILSCDKNSAAWLAIERARLSKQGIAVADWEIATVAYSNNLVLLTRNIRVFAGFGGLRIENWFE
jgi:tRNA(fMet)-specific endonuclease VapC